MSNNDIKPTLDPPEDAFDDFKKIEPTKIDRAELAQHAAMEAGYFDGPIPADIAAPPGLSPKRAELARFLEWRRRTENEIEVLEEAHHRAIEALGGEATTKKKIDALIEADVNEVLRFALDGQQITAKKLRAFERKQLEQKLKDDKPAAQVASKTLGQIEHQIDVKKIGLDFLDNRTERFVKSAVVEAAANPISGNVIYRRSANSARCGLQLVGLRVVVGEHDGFASGPMYVLPKIEMPRFGLPTVAGKELQISVNQQALEKAAAPWRQFALNLLKSQTLMPRLAKHNIEGINYMFCIPYIRAVINDKRLTQNQIKTLLAKTSLPPSTKRAVADAFSEDGMLSDGSIKAAAASVDNDGRYPMKSIDKILANCSTPLSVHARIEIKNILTRASLIK